MNTDQCKTFFDAIIAGGGPAGLSAAATIARAGYHVAVLEQNHEIGSPIRTSGGSFIHEMELLGIPARLYHPISRIRFLAPANSACFDYPSPKMCVLDVRGAFQYLAERAVEAGAEIRLGAVAEAPLIKSGAVCGVRTRGEELHAKLVIDATGYRAALLKQAGLDPGFRRFGVGSEYDLYAPKCDQSEAVLVVGGEFAPSGYAWILPWGRDRVRAGVGVIHPDSRANPGDYLDALIRSSSRFGVNLDGAQAVEHHTGLIPSEQFVERFTGDGILGIGDAAGHASSLLGEGIRWAIHAGVMAGEVAAKALRSGDTSRAALEPFERQWRKRFGVDLKLAHQINLRISRWDDAAWNRRTELLKRLSPDQFAEALKTNLRGRWLWKLAASHARTLVRRSFGIVSGIV